MAHFAELDSNNKVIRVVVGDNNDVEANGGDQSLTAAQYLETVVPFSETGVKWVQTSYNRTFRKNFAGINFTYDEVNDRFIPEQPYPSWSLDGDGDWQPPFQPPNQDQYYEWDEDAYQADNTQGWILRG